MPPPDITDDMEVVTTARTKFPTLPAALDAFKAASVSQMSWVSLTAKVGGPRRKKRAMWLATRESAGYINRGDGYDRTGEHWGWTSATGDRTVYVADRGRKPAP
jgi:hypothetical protein